MEKKLLSLNKYLSLLLSDQSVYRLGHLTTLVIERLIIFSLILDPNMKPPSHKKNPSLI